MKNIFYIILSLLLSVVLLGGVYKMTQSQTSDSTPNISQSESITDKNEEDDSQNDSTGNMDSGAPDSSEDGSEDSSGAEEGDNAEDTALKNPVNVASYIADGLTMVSGASIYLGEEEYGPAIRFTCSVSAEVKEEVDNDANKELAFLIAPVEFFDEVNVNNYTYMDWVTALDNAGKAMIYSVLEEDNFYVNGDNYMARFRLQNVMYKNMNREFVCMMVLATKTSGGTTYKYSAYPTGVTYRSNARSVAYVAAAALNANALGMETFTSDKLAVLKGYINDSVDSAVGHASATNDGSMYAFTVMPTGPKAVKVGERFALQVFVSPAVNIPIWYRSTDESILTVDDNGNVTAKAKGTAVIGVYVAGETVGVTVTVS